MRKHRPHVIRKKRSVSCISQRSVFSFRRTANSSIDGQFSTYRYIKTPKLKFQVTSHPCFLKPCRQQQQPSAHLRVMQPFRVFSQLMRPMKIAKRNGATGPFTVPPGGFHQKHQPRQVRAASGALPCTSEPGATHGAFQGF